MFGYNLANTMQESARESAHPEDAQLAVMLRDARDAAGELAVKIAALAVMLAQRYPRRPAVLARLMALMADMGDVRDGCSALMADVAAGEKRPASRHG